MDPVGKILGTKRYKHDKNGNVIVPKLTQEEQDDLDRIRVASWKKGNKNYWKKIRP